MSIPLDMPVNRTMETIGGAIVGGGCFAWLSAKLPVSADEFCISVGIPPDYRLTPDTVVSIKRCWIIRYFGSGIRIRHLIPARPDVFSWCNGAADALLEGIAETGFTPRGSKR